MFQVLSVRTLTASTPLLTDDTLYVTNRCDEHELTSGHTEIKPLMWLKQKSRVSLL